MLFNCQEIADSGEEGSYPPRAIPADGAGMPKKNLLMLKFNNWGHCRNPRTNLTLIRNT